MTKKIIYDLMDLVTEFTNVLDFDEFCTYMFELYAHSRKTRHVRLFDAITDKDTLQSFLKQKNLNIQNIEEVIDEIKWEFQLWATGITVRRKRLEPYPRIASVVNKHLSSLVAKSREILKSSIHYVTYVDITQFKMKPQFYDEDDTDDDESDDIDDTASVSSNDTYNSHNEHSVLFTDVVKMCKDHIPEATERKEKEQEREQTKAEEEAAEKEQAEKRAIREQKRTEKELKDLERVERLRIQTEKLAIDNAMRKAKLDALIAKNEAEEIKRKEKEAKKKQKEEQAALKLISKQTTGVLCVCGEYYSKSNYAHHKRSNKTHLAYQQNNGGAEF